MYDYLTTPFSLAELIAACAPCCTRRGSRKITAAAPDPRSDHPRGITRGALVQRSPHRVRMSVRWPHRNERASPTRAGARGLARRRGRCTKHDRRFVYSRDCGGQAARRYQRAAITTVHGVGTACNEARPASASGARIRGQRRPGPRSPLTSWSSIQPGTRRGPAHGRRTTCSESAPQRSYAVRHGDGSLSVIEAPTRARSTAETGRFAGGGRDAEQPPAADPGSRGGRSACASRLAL